MTHVIELTALTLALLLAICAAAAGADNSQQGQNEWCWQSENSNTMFCDYSAYSSCVAANRGKEHGACFHR